jgi:transposase
MKHFIAFDVASEVCTACVRDLKGKIKQETMVVTEAAKLKSFVRSVPGQKVVIFEEGTQAAWLYTLFEPICNKVIVCNPSKNSRKGNKNDKIDAKELSEWGRTGLLSPVWHGGEELQKLKELLRTYECLTTQSTRVKNQIRAVFRSRGVRGGAGAYLRATRAKAISKLPLKEQKARVIALGELLDVTEFYRGHAGKRLVKSAKNNKMYKSLLAINGLGPISSAVFIAEVGDPFRFRTRRQFWTYCGLSVVSHMTGEYCQDMHGSIIRKNKPLKTKGLVRACNKHLKCIFKHAALVSSTTTLKKPYQKILKGTKNRANAQLTLARKLAAVALRIAKTGEEYDVNKMFA